MRAALLLALAILAGCTTVTTPRKAPPSGLGSISGKILYPSEVVPQMRICAIPAGQAPLCIENPAGQTSYRIDRLAAGQYTVLVSLSEGDIRKGGHVHQVQCIRAPCPAQPMTVTLEAGTDAQGVDITGFFAEGDPFPSIPR